MAVDELTNYRSEATPASFGEYMEHVLRMENVLLLAAAFLSMSGGNGRVQDFAQIG